MKLRFCIIFLLSVMPLSYMHSETTLKLSFCSYKAGSSPKYPAFSGPLSRSFLTSLRDFFESNFFIETGTLGGETTNIAASLFETVHTIELSEYFYDKAQKLFSAQQHVFVHLGDSGTIIRDLIAHSPEKPIFWLDAHYCGPSSAQGDSATPILQELAAIKEGNLQNAIILIDDARCFGTSWQDHHFTAAHSFPTFAQLREALCAINPHFVPLLIGDIILAYDINTFHAHVSPVVLACTISRMAEERNYAYQDILDAEKVIAQAQDGEKHFIENLHAITQESQYGEFHYALWYALLLEHHQDFNQAYEVLESLITAHPALPWRIYWYHARVAYALGNQEAVRVSLNKIIACEPDFVLAQEMLDSLS